MKKLLAVLMSALILCSAAACTQSGGASSSTETVSDVSAADASSSEASEENIDDLLFPSSPANNESAEPVDHQALFEQTLKDYKFEGVAYAVKGGEEFSFVSGDNEQGQPYTRDMIIPVGSISKQFCAAAVLLLQEQGKLSISDTLDKYFPEYSEGQRITLEQMLCMRSGITNYDENIYDVVSYDNTYEENSDKIIEWLFAQPLVNDPGEAYHYSNGVYYLLATIIEKVTGERYMDFLRESILDPVGMKHTGSVDEMAAGAKWTGGVSYKNVDLQPGVTKGGGDIISTAEDMTLWMNSLTGGKVLSDESFELMTTDYTPSEGYGMGIRVNFFGGIGHPGQIGDYVAMDCMDDNYELTIFLSGDTVDVGNLAMMFTELMRDLKKQ